MTYKNPTPTVDAIIQLEHGIVLIHRANPPYGWAIPGGFVDEGERVEDAARREAKEETGLDVTLEALLYVYSDPARDPRQHTMSVVFTARASGSPVGLDDADEAAVFTPDELQTGLHQSPPQLRGAPIVFDHAQILADFLVFADTGRRPRPV